MENTTSAKVFDALSNVTTVIILRVEKLITKSIDTFMLKPFSQFDDNNTVNELKWFTSALFGRILVVIVVGIYLVSHVITGAILVGTIYILYGYANQIRDVFFKFAYLYNDIVRYRASVSNTEELSKDFRTEVVFGEKCVSKSWAMLSIQSLSFSYHADDGADLHLDGISMDIKKGERIALIGESCGGKTTFLKIMRDLYHPKTLALTMDSVLVPGGFGGIRDSISLIPQDPEIFATTIRENITLGVEHTDERVKTFTDMSRFTQVVDRLPHGLESSIVEKGVNLSGGEKQRLALARGLLASVDKEIILMDEPTSSVDFQNELDIFANIFAAFPEQTVIASVHRLHLLPLFDMVHFFVDGKVIFSGTFAQLKKSSPEFKALWKKYIKTRDI
jgi:ABC-type multidrug transport system fused ATPase/permease subunit